MYMPHCLAVTVILFFMCISANAAYIGQGRVSVNGEILDSACSIHTDDTWQEIVFDVHTPKDVHHNTGVNEMNFSIRLNNCRTSKESGGDWESFSVTFDGGSIANDSSLFVIAGSAKGIALKISNDSGEHAIPGKPMNKQKIDGSENKLHYRMRVVPDGNEFEEGEWFSSLRFMVEYQ